MKYLFIVQGDGRGHMTQAITLSEMLQRNGHEVVEALIGKSKEREIPAFFLTKMKTNVQPFETPSFIFKNDKKHIHLAKTILYNLSPEQIKKYAKSIEMIYKKIIALKPDVILNFYEMLTGFVYLRYNLKIPIIAVGHQYLQRHPDFRFSDIEDKSMLLFKLFTVFCNIGATKSLGLSFYPMSNSIPDRLAVVPPLIRKEVREMNPSPGEYILGYMLNPGYEKEIRNWHEENPEIELHVFWDKKGAAKEISVDDTFTLHALDDELFLEYMAGCKGYVTTAGFESICEAMYLDKPILMIPAHLEQEINAAEAVFVQAGIVAGSFNIGLLLEHINKRQFDNTSFKRWVDSGEEIFMQHLIHNS